MLWRVSTGVRLHQSLPGTGRFALPSQLHWWKQASPHSSKFHWASTYALLRDLVAQDSPGTLTFQRLSEALTAHFELIHLVIAERFSFHKRLQAVGESIAEFDAALRKLAIHCEFGAMLKESLHDRFVRRLQHEGTQWHAIAFRISPHLSKSARNCQGHGDGRP